MFSSLPSPFVVWFNYSIPSVCFRLFWLPYFGESTAWALSTLSERNQNNNRLTGVFIDAIFRFKSKYDFADLFLSALFHDPYGRKTWDFIRTESHKEITGRFFESKQRVTKKLPTMGAFLYEWKTVLSFKPVLLKIIHRIIFEISLLIQSVLGTFFSCKKGYKYAKHFCKLPQIRLMIRVEQV